MREQVLFCTLNRFLAAAFCSLFLIANAFAAPGGGRGGGGSGGDDDGTVDPPDYGDLVIIYRGLDGLPILTAEDGETGLCQQPVMFENPVSCPEELIAAGIDTGVIACPEGVPGLCLVPVDPATCAVLPSYAGCTQEVDFGRINSARAPASMLAEQLDDVVVKLATADCITLDPAGRLVASVVDTQINDEGEEVAVVRSNAIDSPLQNMAIYKQLMMYGYLGDASNPIELPPAAGILDTAARGIGVAIDKGGKVDVDMLVYVNNSLGLTDPSVDTILEKKSIFVRQEVMGSVQLVEKWFLDYGFIRDSGAPYDYGRAGNFAGLPAPAYIPATPMGGPEEGYFEHLALKPGSNGPNFEFIISRGLVHDHVFGTAEGYLDGNIGGFVQAADDTRAVINFMHSWPLPADYATALECEDSGLTGYDLSISPESGLQVPVQMIDGSEGREFIVTVANAGPDYATGTVWVEAVTSSGIVIDGSPWSFDFTDLAPGTSGSWTTLFTVNLGSAATITWTATAVGEFDVNLTNNSVTETTSIRKTGGGGGRP